MCQARGVVIEPVRVKLPVAGSYSSADAKVVEPSVPPVMRTRPSAMSVAVSPTRAIDIDPVALNPGCVGAGVELAATARALSVARGLGMA